MRDPLRPSSPLLPWVLCALLGLSAGLLNGLLGAAGGILLVMLLPRLTPPAALYPPARQLGEYHDRRDILATAPAVMLPIAAVSGISYWLGGIRPSPALLLSIIPAAVAGGLLGAKLLPKIPLHFLKKLFAAVVVIAGLRMLL